MGLIPFFIPGWRRSRMARAGCGRGKALIRPSGTFFRREKDSGTRTLRTDHC
jgi:hypothetical protein